MITQRRWILAAGILAAGVLLLPLFGWPVRDATASPPRQLPNPVVVSGDLSERTLLQPNPLDPGGSPDWRLPLFDDGAWPLSYRAASLPAWGAPAGGEFIWGGPPGACSGGACTIPASPVPQFLFLRDNFCIPINADLASVQASALDIQILAVPGSAYVTYNGEPVEWGLLGGEGRYSVNLGTAFPTVRRLGRNTLAMSLEESVADAYAAVAYRVDFSYGVDGNAITILANPPSPALTGASVTFSRGGNGPGGDAPYTYQWNFGNGATSNAAAPAPVAYTAPGTYTVALTMTDRFGCASVPVSIQYVVLDPTPTPTDTPTPTPTSSPTPTPLTPIPTSTASPPPPPTNTPAPAQPQPTSAPPAAPTPTPSPIPPPVLLLPETGRRAPAWWGVIAVCALSGGAAIVHHLRRRRPRADR